MDSTHPHQQMPVARAGPALDRAAALVILVHGRGGSAEDILTLSSLLLADLPGGERVAFAAPQARAHSWYPFSFLAPTAQNEPGISSGLAAIDEIVAGAVAAGLPVDAMVLGGFSQGACLSSEYAARHPRPYGGLLAFSGGLIGPEGTPREYPGDLEGSAVFLGCSDVDPHIPAERVRETAAVFRAMGASVDLRFFPGMGHTINQEEIDAGRAILRGVLARRGNS